MRAVLCGRIVTHDSRSAPNGKGAILGRVLWRRITGVIFGPGNESRFSLLLQLAISAADNGDAGRGDDCGGERLALVAGTAGQRTILAAKRLGESTIETTPITQPPRQRRSPDSKRPG